VWDVHCAGQRAACWGTCRQAAIRPILAARLQSSGQCVAFTTVVHDASVR
jgi:hypothetical protein